MIKVNGRRKSALITGQEETEVTRREDLTGWISKFSPDEAYNCGGPLPVLTRNHGTARNLACPTGCFHCRLVYIYHPKPGEPYPCILHVSVDSVRDTAQELLRDTA